MTQRCSILLCLLVCLPHWVRWAAADEPKPTETPGCTFVADNFFLDQVWTKVAAQRCLTCHKKGGDAEDSQFILLDPARSSGTERDEVWNRNRQAFIRMARERDGNESRLLIKVTGGLDHGGQAVLDSDSTGYRILADFVERVTAPSVSPKMLDQTVPTEQAPFFDGITMLDERRLLRRATLSLAGRLPTERELAALETQEPGAFVELLDGLMREEAFYDRLREGFNDIFLTIGFDGGAETALAYDHFSKSRLWYQKYDLSHIEDEDKRRKAGYKLADDYRKAILGEPMKLIEYIVRNDRPFTEIVTADYIMVTPFSARGYGIFEEVQTQFRDQDDPFEYIPVKLKALVGRNKNDDQESATGFYPHAGLISTFQYLRRYPTTETNRNRLRARMFYQHFLGVDTLELAARVSDAAAVAAKYEIPTMQASECVVCHKTLDPVAGLFQDYYKFEGVYGRRKGGWYQDMFAAGFEGEDLPAEERWRALQWLGTRTAKDPRFAVAMVEHVFYILTGRKVLLAPKAIDDPLMSAHQRAYREQRREIERIAQRFVEADFNLKQVFKDWILSDFYRTDGLALSVSQPCRLAELDDLGVVRLLAPEQLERKITAIFGERWGKLTEQMAMLYGGIDSKEVTERATDPSGAMGAIQRIMSNDVACRHTGRDFGRPANERLLFPTIDHTLVPGETPEDDAAIRRAIVYLHQRILGRLDSPDSAEVDRSFQLLTTIVAEASQQKGLERQEKYNCRQTTPPPPEDSHYTIRAWRAVITYLLRRPEFLMSNVLRRDFLKLCSWAGMGLTVPYVGALPTRADSEDQPYPGPYTVVFNASGGWDTTYLMDPKGINEMNRLYEAGDILTQGAHRFAPTAKHKTGGASNEDFYAEFGPELLVLNGLDYSVNNHSPGARYMATGKLDSMAYPTFAALVAACQGPTCPLAFLTFGNYSTTGNVVAMSRVPYIPSLQKIANADAVDGNLRSPYHDDFALDHIEKALAETYQARLAEPNLPRANRAYNMLYAAQVNSKALRRVTPHIPSKMPKERLSQQVDIALASFKAGVCVSANLTIGQFDSHANNDVDQMKLIPEFLAGVTYLLHRAEELQIREQLVVIIQSEMGRTPDYNKGNGKDHWSIGSVMFLGKGITGNRVIGATDDRLLPIPIVPQTLAQEPDQGIRVRPEHIHQALREHAGIADHPLSLKFPLGVSEKEQLRGLWG